MTRTPGKDPVRTGTDDVETLKKELAKYQALFGEVNSFLDFVRDQKSALKEAIARTAQCKEAYDAARREESEIRDVIGGAKDSLVRILEPGVAEFFPLFDRMEKPNEEKHGARAEEWRKEPVAALRLTRGPRSC